MTRVRIPHLSANVTDATLTQWMKEPGEAVRKGDALAEITTEKAVFELESTADGILLERLAPVHSMLPVGYIVALIGTPGETDPEAQACNRACLEAARQQREAAPQETPIPNATPSPVASERIRATPKARRIAREQGLSLEVIRNATGAEVLTESLIRDYLAGQEKPQPRKPTA